MDIRLHLTDRAIAKLPAPKKGWYLARDTELKGFFVVVGRRKRTFTVQGDLRHAGAKKSIRVSVGDARDLTTREARAIAKGFLSKIHQGEHPRPDKARTPIGEGTVVASGVTLDQAWERYLNAHLRRKGRSEATIAGYRDHVERIMGDWRSKTLKELAENPASVAARHDQVTLEHGPYIANGTMRTLSAIYNHAKGTNLELPDRNPTAGVDWNPNHRRNTALGLADLPGWFEQLAALKNPIRREFHLFTLLSGSRPGAQKCVRFEDLDLDRRVLHIRKPKGGEDRAFDIPLSRDMIRCLIRAMRYSRLMHPDSGGDWIFAADSAEGHIIETQEDRLELSKFGNDLRQSFRTLAQVAGVSELDARLLMNHAIPGVNAGYITRAKILEDHLRARQEEISAIMLRPARKLAQRSGAIRDWLTPGAARRFCRPLPPPEPEISIADKMLRRWSRYTPLGPAERKAALTVARAQRANNEDPWTAMERLIAQQSALSN